MARPVPQCDEWSRLLVLRKETSATPKVTFSAFIEGQGLDFTGLSLESAAEQHSCVARAFRRPLLFDLDVLRAIFEKAKLRETQLQSFLEPGTRPKRFLVNRRGYETEWAEVTQVHVMLYSYSFGTHPLGRLCFSFYCRGDGPCAFTSAPAQIKVELCAETWRLAYGPCRKPFVNPGIVKLQNAVKVRPYALHWLETYQRAACAPNGRGRKRDLEEFQEGFCA